MESKSPVIKWSGSKRSQASEIVSFFPPFKTFYDPFVGGGSILASASFKKAIAGDICEPLIRFWQLLQNKPKQLIESYKENWNLLQSEGYMHYYKVRDRFNKEKNPCDLLFLSRTCVNGLIRFNRDGKFNNSLHYTRPGINPDSLSTIIQEWALKVKNVEFLIGDYKSTTKGITEQDFVYLDPPYFNTNGRYYGRIDFQDFLDYLEFLNSISVKYVLSFDGTRGDFEYTKDIPRSLYKHHILLASGNSTFRKVIDKKVEKVQESVYLNFELKRKQGLAFFS